MLLLAEAEDSAVDETTIDADEAIMVRRKGHGTIRENAAAGVIVKMLVATATQTANIVQTEWEGILRLCQRALL